jgi:cytochrome P450
MNPELHNNAQQFDPVRYVDKPMSAADYLNLSDPHERDHFTYGTGRGVCPSIHVAEKSLYINMVRTL